MEDDIHPEDDQIFKLTGHKEIKIEVMRILRKQGIDVISTEGNDPRGDIIVINRSDVPLVQQIIREVL